VFALACITLATPATGICWHISSANASKSSVNPEPGRAHGTLISRTPCVGQSIRGTRAVRNA
jgi:hypothetical protein